MPAISVNAWLAWRLAALLGQLAQQRVGRRDSVALAGQIEDARLELAHLAAKLGDLPHDGLDEGEINARQRHRGSDYRGKPTRDARTKKTAAALAFGPSVLAAEVLQVRSPRKTG